MSTYDVAIVGAGVIGTTIARELMHYNLKVVLLEKGDDVAVGTTKANSAIVHAGYDAPSHTLKGQLNVLGNAMYDVLSEELDVPFKRIGSLVIARDASETATLEQLLENGKRLHIPGLEIIDGARAHEMEPHLSGKAVAALYAPSAGITEPWEVAVAACENAMDNGAELKLGFEVLTIDQTAESFTLNAAEESVKAKWVINAAGVYADQIYRMVAGERETFKITPRRGQYYLLDKEAGGFVNHVVFPCPGPMGKGVLIAPTAHGNMIIGPDSQNLSESDKEATETTSDRLAYVKASAASLMDDIPFHLNITTFAGLRAEPEGDDFIIEASAEVERFINVAGIKSPGLSAAPAIAVRVAETIKALMPNLKTNPAFNPIRRPRIRLAEMTPEERDAQIEKDPRFGHMICRCEMITEGEIVDAIHRNAGGRTLNGIKRRARPGAGRCQGGFCGPRVMEILARELGCDVTDIRQEGKESVILTGKMGKGGRS